MKKRQNLFVIFLIIIIIAVSETQSHKKHYTDIESNSYLSSNYEKRSVNYCAVNNWSNNSKRIVFEDFNGKWSLIQFSSNKDNKISITDNTIISKGKFYIVILDSEYNIITKKNELTETGDIIFTTPREGNYIIRIIGENASGKFDISVNASNNINISSVDFFDKDYSSKV